MLAFMEQEQELLEPVQQFQQAYLVTHHTYYTNRLSP
jgi:hypothetical protein